MQLRKSIGAPGMAVLQFGNNFAGSNVICPTKWLFQNNYFDVYMVVGCGSLLYFFVQVLEVMQITLICLIIMSPIKLCTLELTIMTR